MPRRITRTAWIVLALVGVVTAPAAWDGPAAAQSGPPAVVFVVDSSGSLPTEALPRAVATAKAVLAGLAADAPAGVVGVSTTATLLAPLGLDRAVATTALDGLRTAGDTALADGLVLAADALAAHPGPRTVVVFSDGEDTTSTAGDDDAVARLRAATVTVTAVVPPGASVGRTLAAALAGTSGRHLPDLGPAAAGAAVLDGLRPAAPDAGVPAAPVATAAPEPPAGRTAATSNGLLLAVGAAACFAALLVTGLVLFAPRTKRVALLRRHDRRAALADLGSMAAELADRAIRRGSKAHALDHALENAGLQVRGGEFVAAAVGVAALAGLAGTALAGPALGLLLVAVAPIGARAFVASRTKKRRERFADQLDDTLQLLAGSLRAGYGIMQAIDAVARDAEAPTSEEFGRLVVEHRLGRDLQECLWAMAERVDHQDFTWVVQALAIHREVGGDLVEVLDTVATTIRDRARLRRQVKALSAEGRISAQVLFVLPFGVAFVIRFTNPAYFGDLVGTGMGRALLACGGVLLATGGLWMRRIVRPVF